MSSQNVMPDLSHRIPWRGLVRALRAALFSRWPEPREMPYRPERHYMRGPGPKWRAKHVFIDKLPRNASGKLLKRTLREPYWQGYERRVN